MKYQMIKTKELVEYLKSISDYPSYAVGRIFDEQEKILIIMTNNTPIQYDVPVGRERGFYSMNVRLLSRFGKNMYESETKVQELYKALPEIEFTFNNNRYFIIKRTKNAQYLGADPRGVYEYSIDFTIYLNYKDEERDD